MGLRTFVDEASRSFLDSKKYMGTSSDSNELCSAWVSCYFNVMIKCASNAPVINRPQLRIG